jgi:hypothetical protein
MRIEFVIDRVSRIVAFESFWCDTIVLNAHARRGQIKLMVRKSSVDLYIHPPPIRFHGVLLN